MTCAGGRHEWLERVSAERCCNPQWTRITLLPGERLGQVLEDTRVAPDGITHAPDGFKFAWMRIEGQRSDEAAP